MVERVTQRANFGNLRPQAKPVDTFRRQDTRDLDNFIEFANQRLKATQGIIDAGFGAYQTYRESRQEEIAFKAQADAVKGTVDPELQGSWAIYGKQQKRTKGLLKAREEGNKIINDTDFLAGVFNKTEAFNKDKSAGFTMGLEVNKETGDFDVEQVYKKSIDGKINSIIRDNPDIDVEELLRYKGQLDQTFFENVRKNEVNNRVATFREVVRTTLFDKTSPAYQGLFRLYSGDDKATPVDFNKNFYNILGTLTDQGMAEGLTREQSVNVALKEIIGVAYTFDNANSNSGRIIDEEEKLYITNIIGALQDKVTDPRVLKSGSMLMDNNQYREFIFENIEKLDLMLENGEKEDEAEAKKTARSDYNEWKTNIVLDIKFPDREGGNGIRNIADLTKRLNEANGLSWSSYYDVGADSLTSTFNQIKSSGGSGDNDQYRLGMVQASLGEGGLTLAGLRQDPNLIVNTFPKINKKQEQEIFKQILNVNNDRSASKFYGERFNQELAKLFVGNLSAFKNLVVVDGELGKAHAEAFNKFRIGAENIETLYGNATPEEKSKQYDALIERLSEEFTELKKSYFDKKEERTEIDLENLNSMPNWIQVDNAEHLYRAYLFEMMPEAYNEFFPDTSPEERYGNIFNKSKQRATNEGIKQKDAIREDFRKVQIHIFKSEPTSTNLPEKSFNTWYQKLKSKKAVRENREADNLFLKRLDGAIRVDDGGNIVPPEFYEPTLDGIDPYQGS